MIWLSIISTVGHALINKNVYFTHRNELNLNNIWGIRQYYLHAHTLNSTVI